LRHVGDPERNDIVLFVEIDLASDTVYDLCAMTYTVAVFSPQLSHTAARSHQFRHTDFTDRAQITRAAQRRCAAHHQLAGDLSDECINAGFLRRSIAWRTRMLDSKLNPTLTKASLMLRK
jgi:hypothetical protein